jgi:hypothetical protein
MFLRKRSVFVLFFCFIGSCFQVFAQEQKIAQVDMVLANGSGDVISEIEIKPSKSKYKNNKNVYALQNISIADKSSVGIDLPPVMKTMDSFDIVVKYGKKTAKTKKSFTVEKNGSESPLYVLSLKGKNSTVPIIAGVGGAGVTAAGIGGFFAGAAAGVPAIMAITGSQAVSAAAVTELLVIIGGSMVSGVAIIAAAPVVIGGGIFAAVFLLSAKELVLTKIDFVVQ